MDRARECPALKSAADVLFLIAISPNKFGVLELFAQQLAADLERRGRSIAFCFATEPSAEVRGLLDRPNTRLVHLREQGEFSRTSVHKLWKLLKSVRPETVVYSFGGILRPLPWLCKLAGVERVIYNDHASRVPGDEAGSYLKNLAARAITHPVSAVIAVSEFVAERSRQEGLHGAPVVTIANGIDTQRRGPASGAEFRRRYGIPADKKVVSQLSWLVEEKGVDILLKAAAEVRRQRDDVHFLIGGDGRERKRYERMAAAAGLASDVTFTGPIADPLTSGFYPASDVFCLASRWYEACGAVLLEAMSFAVPVVASRLGGIPEFVRDGIDGLLSECEPEAFARALLTLLADDDRRRSMGESERQSVEQRFDVRRMAQRYGEFLSAAAGAPRQQ